MARPYKSIAVSHFSAQQTSQRFPNYDPVQLMQAALDNPDLLQETDETNPSLPPRIAEWRSNLVALSQKDNLYFAAYEHKIHVTTPRDLKQTIPGTPDLILETPVSYDARQIGGFIDPSRPHCVNNMVVGDLGSQEILLLACDDGDIIAYYVHSIITCMKSGAKPSTIKPFFHENIGSSAWGLVIHGQSRLLAASCNLRQVTVFMPAYTSGEEEVDVAELPDKIFSEVAEFSGLPPTRKASVKKIFRLGPEGHNIPSLSFADDTNGEARSILAVDISGNLWIFGLYDGLCQRIPSIHEASYRGERSMGWGVLVMPLKAFKRTSKTHEALGGVIKLQNTLTVGMVDKKPVKLFDITGSTSSHRDNHSPFPGHDPSYGYYMSPLTLENDSESEESDGESWTALEEKMADKLNTILARAGTPFGRRRSDSSPEPLGGVSPMLQFEWDTEAAVRRSQDLRTEFSTIDVANLVNMHPKDLFDITKKEELHNFLDSQYHLGPLEIANKGRNNPDAFPFLVDGSAILRTYQCDLELLAPTPACPRTLCRKIIKHNTLHHGLEGLRAFARLNLVLAIPQLSLAIIASQAGRAALVSLTRVDDRYSLNGPVVSFRVDGFLPAREHAQEVVWPRRPLLGIAVSPLQTDGRSGGGGAGGSGDADTAKRWRLIMHYYDHTILSYELSRNAETDVLAVL